MRRSLESYLRVNKAKWSGPNSAAKIHNGSIESPESNATSAASASPIKPIGSFTAGTISVTNM